MLSKTSARNLKKPLPLLCIVRLLFIELSEMLGYLSRKQVALQRLQHAKLCNAMVLITRACFRTSTTFLRLFCVMVEMRSCLLLYQLLQES